MTRPPQQVLLYDGLCAFCDRTVAFILAHERRRTMKFAPLRGPFAAAVLARHPEIANVDSLVLVETDGNGERIYIRSDAVLRVADYLGGGWKMARALRLIPRFMRDLGYDVFARFRYRAFGRLDACPLPPLAVRARFLD